LKVCTTMLPVCAWGALAFVAVAHGSNEHTGDALAPTSTSARHYCVDLQQGTSAESFQFSGWRCSQGPAVRGYKTILAWVKMTRPSGDAHVELVWVVETEPARNAQVIDATKVPHYGYVPSDVREAFRARAADHLSA